MAQEKTWARGALLSRHSSRCELYAGRSDLPRSRTNAAAVSARTASCEHARCGWGGRRTRRSCRRSPADKRSSPRVPCTSLRAPPTLHGTPALCAALQRRKLHGSATGGGESKRPTHGDTVPARRGMTGTCGLADGRARLLQRARHGPKLGGGRQRLELRGVVLENLMRVSATPGARSRAGRRGAR